MSSKLRTVIVWIGNTFDQVVVCLIRILLFPALLILRLMEKREDRIEQDRDVV